MSGYRSRVGTGGLLAALLCLLFIQCPCFAQEGRVNPPASPSGPYQGFGYPWENNNLGISSEVPAPWTPLEYRPNVVTCWGREYLFGNGILPTQIMSQGQALFAGRPEFAIMIDGKNLSKVLDANPAFTQENKNRAAYQLKHHEEAYHLELSGSLEYDGLLRIDLAVSAKRPVTLNQLLLSLPLNKSVALFYSRYLKYDPSEQKVVSKDLLQSYGRIGKPVEMKFNPAVWIGNHDVGIEWICETNAPWSNEYPAAAIKIVPASDRVVLRIDVVSKPLRIDGEYVFSFALYPTPVKSLPEDWRSYTLIDASPKPPGISTAGRKSYGIAWPPSLRFQGLPIMEASETQAAKFEGLPEQFEGGSLGPAVRVREIRDVMQKSGVKLIPYGAFHGLSASLPLGEWKDYGTFWSVFGKKAAPGALSSSRTPVEEPRRSGIGFSYICPFSKSFRDFLVWQYVQAIEKYDIGGMYLDLVAPGTLCRNQNHPHGQLLERGYEYYPFFWQRQFMQRLYIACKSRKPDFLISVHHSKVPIICSGFADLVVNGEPLQISFVKKPRVLKLGNSDASAYLPDYSRLPESFFEIQCSQRRGFISMLLPEIIKRNERVMEARPDLFKYYTRTLLARAAVFDIPLSAKRMDLISYNNLIKAQERFGWLTGSRYYGPWESGKFVGSGSLKLRLALYLKPQDRKLMMVAANLSDQETVEEISLNLEELKKSGVSLQVGYHVTDLLENRPYPAQEGRIKLIVPAQDFRIFAVQ